MSEATNASTVVPEVRTKKRSISNEDVAKQDDSKVKKLKTGQPTMDDFVAFVNEYKRLQTEYKELEVQNEALLEAQKKQQLEVSWLNEEVKFEVKINEELYREHAKIRQERDQLDWQKEALHDEVCDLQEQIHILERDLKKCIERFDNYKERVKTLGSEQ